MIGQMSFWVAALMMAFNAAAMTPEALEKAIQFPVEKYKLKNGLTVLLSPDTTIPSVSVHTWFRVGSKDEIVGRTGLAHFFEHMMFKGTSRYGKDTFSKFLKGKGADTNAFTSSDYTGYYINAPSEHLALLLDIEGDRMRNLVLDPKDIQSEREVVKEERRVRTENSIPGSMREKMMGLMYQSSPYRWPVIGYMTDLNAASMSDMHSFYRTYYSPNNAVLVIVGNFNASEAKALIEKTHGALPMEEIKRPPSKPEPEQKKERRVVIDREAQAPSFNIVYHTPDASHKDQFALDLIAIILGKGESSRLHRQLVYKNQVALSAQAYTYQKTLSSEFGIDVDLKPTAHLEKSILTVEYEVKRLREAPISQKELSKARNIAMKSYVDALKSISGRAYALASSEIMHNDYRQIFTDLAEYQKVKVSDIERVASKYLNPNQRNIVIVNPKKAGML